MTHESDAIDADSVKVHALVRRVLRSGGLDLDAVEELVFLQEFDDALGLTATTDPATERSILHEAFDRELGGYITELLADNRLTDDERLRLRSSMQAASGRMFDKVAALAPYLHLLSSTPD